MGPESCPHCGKPFKRLKSHLPYCRAAEASGASQHEAPSTQRTPSSSLLSSKKTEKKTKREKSTPTLSLTASPEAMKKTSAPQKSVDSSSSSQVLSSSSRSTPTTKKKLKLADEIQLAASVCLPSSTPPPLSPSSLSKPKKKSLRALIEAANNKEEEKALERSGSASLDLLSVPTSHGTETGASATGAAALSRTGTSPEGDPNRTQPEPVSADTKPKGVSKKKVSKREDAAKSISTDQGTSWLDSQSEGDILSGNLESTYGSRITLKGVKATLGRHPGSQQSSRPSILDQVQTTDDQPSKTTTSPSPSPAPAGRSEGHAVGHTVGHAVGCLVTPVASPEKPPSTLEQRSSPAQTQLTPLLPLMSPYLTHTLSMNQGLKANLQLPSQAPAAQVLDGETPTRASLASSDPVPALRPPPLPPQNVPAMARSAEGPATEKKPHVETLKPNATDNQNQGVLTQRTLGQVKLRELPGWFACKTPNRPKDVTEMLQKGWQWSNWKYSDVRRRGAGRLGLLIAGVCVLGYIWTYPPKSDGGRTTEAQGR